ncbi:MAG: response regulator [Anaerolineales bacterium]|nr:response regulator [Anaerolineales bacterium]MCX7608955.1 response regulator [Anaerolineales bacterium]
MGRTILYIEDNPDNMMLIKRVMDCSGFILHQAFSGQEGLKIITSEPIDLVLLDINLPDIDGYEVTRRIRQSHLPYASRIPILILTANVQHSDMEKALQAGATEFITKPVDVFALCEKIESYLSSSSHS